MNNKKEFLSRRNFLKHTTIGATGIIAIPTILSSCAKGANDRVLIGHIGLGSRGQEELKSYYMHLETAFSVAACDTFDQRRNASAAFINNTYREKGWKAPKCKSYRHFEEVLERDDIDGVTIVTPDHWHVPAAIHAARAGKHIMLAKPLGLSYPNFKILENELKANDVRFHYATQQRSMEHMQVGIQMIKDGLIGEIERVEVWAPGYNPVESPVCNEVAVPDDFDFDKWTGPAPLNTYCPERVTNNSSWFQYDYSIGFLGGWGAHPLDVIIWGLKDKLSGKYTCEATGEFWQPGGMYNNIRDWNVNLEYDSGVTVHFVDSDLAYQTDMLNYRKTKEGNGTTFFGSKGWISLSRGTVESDNPEIHKKLNELSKSDKGFAQMFIDIIKGKMSETNPLEDAILSDCISHMGDIAIRTARKITWDPIAGEVENDAEANGLFKRQMREPYNV
jgi:predicted dehydrogenase